MFVSLASKLDKTSGLIEAIKALFDLFVFVSFSTHRVIDPLFSSETGNPTSISSWNTGIKPFTLSSLQMSPNTGDPLQILRAFLYQFLGQYRSTVFVCLNQVSSHISEP